MKNQTPRPHRTRGICHALVVACSAGGGISTAIGANTAVAPDSATLEEVIVTARQRAESLQRVPDSVTAFTADVIEQAGITDIAGFMDKTPNLFLQQASRAGEVFITMRGVSNGQNGWAPVTLVVDGIPTATIEGFNQGTLFDLERIEVLRGPQSALYGAGAIAGAINIVTRQPTDRFTADAQGIAALGSDYRVNAAVAGPLAAGFKFRLAGSFRHKEGVYDDTDGSPLDREDHKALRANLLGEFSSVTLDLRANLVDSHPGAFMQTVIPTTDPAELEKIISAGSVPDHPARGIHGYEDRRIREFSGKVSWRLPFGELTVLGGHSTIDQHEVGSASWLKPPAPATFCGPVGGIGEPADCFQDNTDNVTTTTADVRLTSSSEQRLRWLFGVAYIKREALNSFFLDDATLSSGGQLIETGPPYVFGSTHLRHDRFNGVYGQANFDITPRTELTLAGRWDRNRYDDTQYSDLTFTQIIPQADGTLTQRATDSKFQPKAQLSYRWTDDVMSYISVARGFRSGYFNSGSKTAPETTTNYELGLKTVTLDGRLSMNSAIFHINYSNQQISTIIPTPPFRSSTNIPSTSIDGVELEIAARPLQRLTLSAGVGVTDARVADGTTPPITPPYTLDLAASYAQPVAPTLTWLSRMDYRRQGSYYLVIGNHYNVGPKDYLNLRSSFEFGSWSAGLWVENLLNQRQIGELAVFPFYTEVLLSLPRTYGAEFRYHF